MLNVSPMGVGMGGSVYGSVSGQSFICLQQAGPGAGLSNPVPGELPSCRYSLQPLSSAPDSIELVVNLQEGSSP